jgi:hypothetical protein
MYSHRNSRKTKTRRQLKRTRKTRKSKKKVGGGFITTINGKNVKIKVNRLLELLDEDIPHTPDDVNQFMMRLTMNPNDMPITKDDIVTEQQHLLRGGLLDYANKTTGTTYSTINDWMKESILRSRINIKTTLEQNLTTYMYLEKLLELLELQMTIKP